MFTRTPSPHPWTAFALAVLLVFAATAVVATETDPPSTEGRTEQAAVDRAAIEAPAFAPASLYERIDALIDARDAKIAALQKDFRNAASEEEALAVQRDIERTALVTEAAVLYTQLEVARDRADAESVTRLEASLAILDPDGEIAATIALDDAEVDR